MVKLLSLHKGYQTSLHALSTSPYKFTSYCIAQETEGTDKLYISILQRYEPDFDMLYPGFAYFVLNRYPRVEPVVFFALRQIKRGIHAKLKALLLDMTFSPTVRWLGLKLNNSGSKIYSFIIKFQGVMTLRDLGVQMGSALNTRFIKILVNAYLFRAFIHAFSLF